MVRREIALPVPKVSDLALFFMLLLPHLEMHYCLNITWERVKNLYFNGTDLTQMRLAVLLAAAFFSASPLLFSANHYGAILLVNAGLMTIPSTRDDQL